MTTTVCAAGDVWSDGRVWSKATALAFVAGNSVGALLLAAGWYAAGGEATLAAGAPWANVSALGLAVALSGNAVYLAGARARVGVRARDLAAARASRHDATATQAHHAAGDPVSEQIVGLNGGTFYHQPQCALVRGKAARPVDDLGAPPSVPCGWCRP